MNAYEELQTASREAAVWMVTDTPEGREKAAQALLGVILKVVGRIGHNVAVRGEAGMNEAMMNEAIDKGSLEDAYFAIFLAGNRLDDEACEMRRRLGLEQ